MNDSITQTDQPIQKGVTWMPRIIISDNESIHAIFINDIIYLEAEGSYTRVVTGEKSYYSSQPLKMYQQLLNELPFFRSHHSYVVNLNYMKRYDKACRYIQLIDGSKIAVSFRKKEQLLRLLMGGVG